MNTLDTLRSLIAQGEAETLELKRSTAELRCAGETLSAFLDGARRKVLIGVGPDRRLVGLEVADITLRDIAAMLGRLEPPACVEMSRVDEGSGRQVIVLDAAPSRQCSPFVFESKPYNRVSSTTTVMSHAERLDVTRRPPLLVGLGLRLIFPREVSGPVCLGYAAHYGLGLFAPEGR